RRHRRSRGPASGAPGAHARRSLGDAGHLPASRADARRAHGRDSRGARLRAGGDRDPSPQGRGVMPRRKVVIASMMHETNTFSPVPTPLEAFRPLSGEAAIAEFEGTNTQLGGFLDVAKRMGADVVVALAAGAHPSGYVERRAYEHMCHALG